MPHCSGTAVIKLHPPLLLSAYDDTAPTYSLLIPSFHPIIPKMRSLERAFFLVISLPALYYYSRIEKDEIRVSIATAAAFSFLAFAATHTLVPLFSWYLARRGLKGRDMGRRGTPLENVELCVVLLLR